MGSNKTMASILGSEFESKYHLHLVPEYESEIPKLHGGWRQLIDEQELWYTLWDYDALETELQASFGEKATQRALEMEEQDRTELWLFLVVYLEGGIAFTPAIDLIEVGGMFKCITKNEELVLVTSEEEGTVLVAGFEGSEKLKRIINNMLGLEEEKSSDFDISYPIFKLEDISWIEMSCDCGSGTTSTESSEYQEGNSEIEEEDEDSEDETKFGEEVEQ